jgi:type IV secretion system protein VirB5
MTCRIEHWGLSVTYYRNPKQISDQANVFPQFEIINPLGSTITELHESRLSVTPMALGTAAAMADGAVRLDLLCQPRRTKHLPRGPASRDR